jgi:hypothetical protein
MDSVVKVIKSNPSKLVSLITNTCELILFT